MLSSSLVSCLTITIEWMYLETGVAVCVLGDSNCGILFCYIPGNGAIVSHSH